jgi:hypothetical protein
VYKKTKKLRARFYSNAINASKCHNLTLVDYLSLCKSISGYKRTRRLEKRHGKYTDWKSARKEFIWVSVPIKLSHNNEIIAYEVFLKKDNVPNEGNTILKFFD